MKSNIFLHNFKHIFFVGIGGISLSGLAKLCLHNKIQVSGSDLTKSHLTINLENLGAKIYYNHSKKNLECSVDLVVYSSAIKKCNPELQFAIKNNISIMDRAEFLNKIMQDYKNTIAVSGMHGKTTTCGMLASIFVHAKKNPTVHIGGESSMTNGNFRIGSKNFFITEACEYKNNFLKIVPSCAIVLNMEMDHPDFYNNLDSVHKSFSKFSNSAKELCVINSEYKHSINLKNNCLTFGSNCNANFYAQNITTDNLSISFDCYKNGEFYYNFSLSVYGKHNVLNALAVIAVADYYKIEKSIINLGLKNFKGIKRRFEYINSFNNCNIIHDYAHHPTEIKAVLESAKSIFKKNIICVFQPHTYSRTKKLFNDFLTCFNNCEETIIFKTYSAREKKTQGLSGKHLYKKFKQKSFNARYFENFNKTYNYLVKKIDKDCILMILGAGDIEKLAYMFQ